jgi:L-asparaginase II
MSSSVPLVEVRRGGRVECVHRGWFAVTDATGKLLAASGALPAVFARSSAKPVQALVLVDSGACDAFGLTEREIAVATASHAAEPFHLEAVDGILAKAGVAADALRCGAHAPLGDPCAPKGVRQNNCSGKHAGMLAACRHSGWQLETYLEPDNPLQTAIRDRFAALSGVLVSGATDGCGVPAWHLPLECLAMTLARLADDPAGRRILDAMRRNPDMVAGTGRRDTLLMQATQGRLVSKGGAEGVSVGCDPEAGVGWAIKIEDGSSRAVGPAVLALLRRLDLISEAEYDSLASAARPELRNHAGTLVGEISAV